MLARSHFTLITFLNREKSGNHESSETVRPRLHPSFYCSSSLSMHFPLPLCSQPFSVFLLTLSFLRLLRLKKKIGRFMFCTACVLALIPMLSHIIFTVLSGGHVVRNILALDFHANVLPLHSCVNVKDNLVIWKLFPSSLNQAFFSVCMCAVGDLFFMENSFDELKLLEKSVFWWEGTWFHRENFGVPVSWNWIKSKCFHSLCL